MSLPQTTRFTGLILLVFAVTAFSYAAEPVSHVRIRILSKYKPDHIILTNIQSGQQHSIELNSVFPFTLNQAQQFKVNLPKQALTRRYPGTLSFYKTRNHIEIINTVSLEEYVQNVVLSELGWYPEQPAAIKAQAVLIRTWALTHIRSNKRFDFGDLTNAQNYHGLPQHAYAIKDILMPTQGIILTYEHKPIQVFYHALCSDRTFSANEIWGINNIVYLPAKSLPAAAITNLDQGQQKKIQWQRSYPSERINKIMQQHLKLKIPLIYRKKNKQRQIGIEVNNHWIAIDRFRIMLNRELGWNAIRSNDFDIQQTDDRIHFNGRGLGHLVGLCQRNALSLAKSGWDYRKILDFFYPGTRLQLLGNSNTPVSAIGSSTF